MPVEPGASGYWEVWFSRTASNVLATMTLVDLGPMRRPPGWEASSNSFG